jgi:hypothetical protein
VRAWRRDAARHPSPNAGVVEATFAGALGVRLGGPTHYHHELQIRPTLGDGRQPTVADLRRAVVLSRAVQAAAALVVLAAVGGLSHPPHWPVPGRIARCARLRATIGPRCQWAMPGCRRLSLGGGHIVGRLAQGLLRQL